MSILELPEMLHTIFGFIDAGSTYKAVMLVSLTWYDVAIAAHSMADITFANHLATLLVMYPNASWNWSLVSSNPNITYKFVAAHPEMPWCWRGLSSNPRMTPEVISAHPELPWQYKQLSMNPSITIEFVMANPGADWDWTEFEHINDEILAAHPELPFAEKILGQCDDSEWMICTVREPNPGSFEYALTDPVKYAHYISMHPNTTWADICANKHSYTERGVCMNPNVTLNIVRAHPGLWNYSALSENPNITLDDALADPNKPWYWTKLCSKPIKNPYILVSRMWWSGAIQSLMTNSTVPWDVCVNIARYHQSLLSLSPTVTWKRVRDSPDIKWSFINLSRNTFGRG